MKNNKTKNNGKKDIDVVNLLNDELVTREEIEELDITEPILKLLDLLADETTLELLTEYINQAYELELQAVGQLQTENAVAEAHNTYRHLIDAYFEDKEEDVFGERLSKLIGFGKREREEISDLAYEQASKLMVEAERLEEMRKQNLLQMKRGQQDLVNLVLDLIMQHRDKRKLLGYFSDILNTISR